MLNYLSRMRNSRPTVLKDAAYRVHHMEQDLYYPGKIIYTNYHALKRSDGYKQANIAGDTFNEGYKEGVGRNARFHNIYGFTQISAYTIIVADMTNHCLRKINRKTLATSRFSGKCRSWGYASGGSSGRFNKPWTIIKDVKDSDSLLVTDYNNSAIRRVSIKTGSVSTVAKSSSLTEIRYIAQDANGDIYATADHAVYKVSPSKRRITLLSGSSRYSGYTDRSLRDSRYYNPHDIKFIGDNVLLVADSSNKRVRALDLTADRVSTVDLCSGCVSSRKPYSLLRTGNAIYIGTYKKIQKLKCKFSLLSLLYCKQQFCGR